MKITYYLTKLQGTTWGGYKGEIEHKTYDKPILSKISGDFQSLSKITCHKITQVTTKRKITL